MVAFVGFTDPEEVVIRQAYTEAALCLASAQRTRKGVDPDRPRYIAAQTKYFGNLTAEQEKTVRGVIKAMSMATAQGTYLFQRQRGDSGFPFGKNYGVAAKANVYGDRREALVFQSGTEPAEKYRDEVIKAFAGKPDPILINDSFFDTPIREMDTQNQISGLLHEISHHAANTNDETFCGIELYGWPGIKTAIFTGVAHNNAENYGFFIASLRLFN